MTVDPNIQKKANDIRTKTYGKEVRESLASGLEEMSKDIEETKGRQDSVEAQFQSVIEETRGKDVISAPEISAALVSHTGTRYNNLKERLDKEHQEVTSQLAHLDHKKADETWVESIIASVLDGGPSIFFDTYDALVNTFPNGAAGVALVRETDPAHIYVWDESKKQWVDYGAYQGVEVKDESITFPKLAPEVNTSFNYPATNLIKNGLFSSTTGWWNRGSVGVAEHNTYKATGTGTNYLVGIYTANNYTFTGSAGHKIFVKVRIRVTNSEAEGISIYANTPDNDYAYMDGKVVVQTNPIKNSWYDLMGIIELPSEFNGKEVHINFMARYKDSATAEGNVTEVYRPFAIDLTKIFGEGNEPTTYQTFELLRKFPSHWFDGKVESFANIKEYANSKVSKIDFNTLEQRVTETEAETRYPATNLLKNSGFRQGRTGWNVNGGTGTVAYNTYSVVGDGTFYNVGIRNITENNITGKAGHKIYVSAYMRVTNSNAEGLSIYMTDQNTFVYLNNLVNQVKNPIANAWYTVKGIIEIPPELDGKSITTYITARYPDAETAKDMRTEIYGSLVALDLTEIFGAGNEPTVDEIYKFMAKYPSRWFDGSVNSLLSMKEYIEHVKKLAKEDTQTELNDYTTIPTYTDGKLTSLEELDGTEVKKRITITYNTDGSVNTVTEEIKGQRVVSTLHYTDGVFTSITKEIFEGGL